MKKLFVLALVLSAGVIGCSSSGNGTATSPSTAETQAEAAAGHELKTGQVLNAAHGTKSFASATVVLEDDIIVLAYLDEYQYLDSADAVGVPNSENFGDYVTDGYVLGSKRVNNESYSANMAKAGSTVKIYDNYEAIQNFVRGKTIAELEALTAQEAEKVTDAVSGATLTDTGGYIKTIIMAAENARENEAVSYQGELADLAIHQLEGAAHGTKCFTLTTVVTDGTVVVSAYIDEFQYLAGDTATGVPNSENLTDYVAEGYVLGSKRVNAETYSTSMAQAGSTVAIDENYDLIQAYAAGKSIDELKALESKTAEEVLDAVSSATLADTANYIKEVVRAAEATK